MAAPILNPLTRPLGPTVQITNWDQLAPQQRANKQVWRPAALTTGAAWVTVATNTGDITLRESAPPMLAPPWAVGIKVIVAITTNTATAQVLQFLAMAEDGATSVTTGAAAAWSFQSSVTGNVWRNTLDCPLYRGSLRWTVITSGTPRYDISLFHTGWVLG